jgi:hypothetical protein
VQLEDEMIGLRSRLVRLQHPLRFISEPLAVVILQGVIADIEARIAAVGATRRHRLVDRVKPHKNPN